MNTGRFLVGFGLLIATSGVGVLGQLNICPVNESVLPSNVGDLPGGTDLATDGNGTWIAVWGHGAEKQYASIDNGMTWSAPATLGSWGQGTGAEGAPRVAGDAQGNWVVVWAIRPELVVPDCDMDILYVRSTDGGVTWSDAQALNLNSDTDCPSYEERVRDERPDVVTDGQDNWIVTWAQSIAPDFELAIVSRRSTDNGATWSAPQAISTDSWSVNGVSLATDGQGAVVVSWSLVNSFSSGGTFYWQGKMYTARSADNGLSWSAPQQLFQTTSTDPHVPIDSLWIATDGLGNWGTVIAYEHGYPDRVTEVLYYRSTDNGLTWSGPTILASATEEFVRIAADGQGNWVVTFWDDTFRWSTDNGATWGPPLQLGSEFYGVRSIAADEDGNWGAILYGGHYLRFPCLVLIDPRLALLEGHELADVTDVNHWITSGEFVSGVVADGTTTLVVRAPAIEPAQQLTIDIMADDELGGDVGCLAPLDGGAGCSTTLMVWPEMTESGPTLLAQYKAPSEFLRTESGGLDLLAEDRRIRLTVDRNDGSPPQERLLTVRRPPLLLLHGLFSSKEDSFKEDYADVVREDGKRTVIRGDYGSTSAAWMSTNVTVPRDWIEVALTTEKQLHNVAATQADVVGHSMGGLLTRRFMQNDLLYLRPENLLQGDVHRLVTVNTPHKGSPVADLLFELGDACDLLPPDPTSFQTLACTSVYPAISLLMTGRVDGFREGATADLRWMSPPIVTLEQSDVPSHALTSNTGGGVIPGDALYKGLWALLPTLHLAIVGTGITPVDVFCNEEHDWMVPIRSQEDGLGLSHTTDVGVATHSQAVGVEYSSELVSVLNERSDNLSVWGQFSANSPEEFCPQTSTSAGLPSSMAESSTAVAIVQPASGTSVTPGETVSVNIDATDAVEVLVMGDGIAETLTSSPYSTAWQIPEDVIGEVMLFVLASGPSGLFEAIDGPYEYPVTLSEPPLSIDISPPVVPLLGPGDTWPLHVTGVYADGIERDLTEATAGTTYSTSDGSVAVVSSGGVVTAIDKGTAQVLVNNGSLNASASAVVDFDCSGPVEGIPAPSAPMSIRLESKEEITPGWYYYVWSWDPVSDATTYFAVTGDLAGLRSSSGDFSVSAEQCLGTQGLNALAEFETPGPGEANWLVFAAANCQMGTYDSGSTSQVDSRDAEVAAAPIVCP